MNGLVNLLVAIALVYILFKIPFWVLSSIRGRGGRSLIGSLVKGFIAYKTYGLLSGRGGGGAGPRPRPSRGGSHGGRGGSVNTDADPRTTASGQYVLPLSVRRTRSTAKPKPSGPAPKRPAGQGRQLALPLGDDWPENKPVLGRDGQYRLPLDVQRTTPPPPSPTGSDPRGRRTRGTQLELPFDPYKGNRPTRSGQYPLPLDGVRRVPRPASPRTPSTPPATRTSTRGRVVQPELPFDPFKGNRPTRSGQYPLPLDGVRRAPKPAPPPSSSSVASRSAPPAGRQLRLPLDLPKPAKPPRSSPPPPPPSQAGRSHPRRGGKTP
jgi:hypothetical protein